MVGMAFGLDRLERGGIVRMGRCCRGTGLRTAAEHSQRQKQRCGLAHTCAELLLPRQQSLSKPIRHLTEHPRASDSSNYAELVWTLMVAVIRLQISNLLTIGEA